MKTLLLTLILCSASAIQIAQANPQTITVDQKHSHQHLYIAQTEDLPNFHQVHDYLYRGGEPTTAGLSKVKALGVTTVIDLRSPLQANADEPTVKKLGMQFINLPMSSQAPTTQEINTFIKTVENAQQTHHPVFVHCAHGSDRTGCMVGIWRVTHENWSYDQAHKEMLKYYFNPRYTQLSNTVIKYSEHQSQSTTLKPTATDKSNN